MTPLSNLAVRDVETLVHPYTNLATLRESGPLVLERGKGIFVYDSNGKAYIEGMSGLWCTALGYGNEELAEAAAAQMRKLSFAHLFSGKSHDPAIELAERLKEIAPVPTSKVFFCNSGSEANDTQVKLVWYMNNALGRPQKKKIISRLKAYHGVTIASASLTGLPANQRDFDLPIAGILHAGCPHHYRFAQAGESEEEFATRLAAELAQMIEQEGPDTVAAFIAEPVMGAGGVLVPPRSYFEKIMAGLPPLRRLHDRRRGDLRLRAARHPVRQPGARISPGRDLGRQGADLRLRADGGRDGAGAHVSGAADREPQDRHLRPRLHLFGPSGGGGGGLEGAGNLRPRPPGRGGGAKGAAVPGAPPGARAASAGRARRAGSASSGRSSWSPTRRASARSIRSPPWRRGRCGLPRRKD